jgi:hypothetical protein
VTLNQLSLSNKDEKVRLQHAEEIINFSNNKYLYRPLSVRVEKLELNNALRILPSLKSLKGQLTGDLDFTYDNQNLEFKPKNGFLVHNLGLIVGEDKKPFTILMIKRAKLSTSSFRLINKEFQMDSLVELNNSLLDVHGFVNSKRVSFTAKDLGIYPNLISRAKVRLMLLSRVFWKIQ